MSYGTVFHLVGYARVATAEQNLELRLDTLKVAGCGRIFVNKASGVEEDRPQRMAALNYLRPGENIDSLEARPSGSFLEAPDQYGGDPKSSRDRLPFSY